MSETTITLSSDERDYLWRLLDEDAKDLRNAKTAIFNEDYYEKNYGSKLKLNNNICSQLVGQFVLKDLDTTNVSKDPTQAA